MQQQSRWVACDLPIAVPTLPSDTTSAAVCTMLRAAPNALRQLAAPAEPVPAADRSITNDKVFNAKPFPETLANPFGPLSLDPHSGGYRPQAQGRGECLLTSSPAVQVVVQHCTSMLVEFKVRRRRAGKTSRDGESEGAADVPEVVASRVRGVVSRRLAMPTAADFSFSLSDPSAPLRSAAFAPASFLPQNPHNPRQVPYRYHPVGTSVRTRTEAHQVEWMKEKPPMQPPLGSGETSKKRFHADELRVFEHNFEVAPMWSTGRFVAVAIASGACPRHNLIKAALLDETYSFPSGPFRRMRIRYGVDPTQDASLCYFQRLSLRIFRHTPLGVLLQDLSTRAGVEHVLAALVAESVPTPALPPHRIHKVATYASWIRQAQLFVCVTLHDVLDDPVVAQILNTAIKPKKCDDVYGWWPAATLDRVAVYLQEDCLQWAERAVVPRLGQTVATTEDGADGRSDAGSMAASSRAGSDQSIDRDSSDSAGSDAADEWPTSGDDDDNDNDNDELRQI